MQIFLKMVVLGAVTLALKVNPLHAATLERAQVQGRVGASEPVTFDVYLPLRDRAGLDAELEKLQGPASAEYHKWLTPAEVNARYGPTAEQAKAVTDQLTGYGLEATRIGGRRIKVRGPASAVERAFSTTLSMGKFASGGTTVMASGALTMAGAMATMDVAVVGLSERFRSEAQKPKAGPRVTARAGAAIPQNRTSALGPYYADDFRQAYKFPSALTVQATNQTIGLISSGAFNPADIALYGVDPYVSIVGVQDPMSASYPDVNLEMAVEHIAQIAPGADFRVYLAGFTQGYLPLLLQMLEDNQVSIALLLDVNASEYSYTAQFNDGLDESYLVRLQDSLFATGNAQGITFVVPSGDLGALAGVYASCYDQSERRLPCPWVFPDAEFPASSPHVTAVGGTQLTTVYGGPGDLDSTYVSESSFGIELDNLYSAMQHQYYGSGGGSSRFFDKPAFQTGVVPSAWTKRAIPDVAMPMGNCDLGDQYGDQDSDCIPGPSGDVVFAGGQEYLHYTSTAAAAADFAGLVALTASHFGERQGNLNPYIYGLAAKQAKGLVHGVFNQGIPAFNGYNKGTATGYNRVVGNGSVNGAAFMGIPDAPLAGTPGTPSNP